MNTKRKTVEKEEYKAPFKFSFVENKSGEKFFAQKVFQTNTSVAYAITWMDENGQIKVEIFSVHEVEHKLKFGSWLILKEFNGELS